MTQPPDILECKSFPSLDPAFLCLQAVVWTPGAEIKKRTQTSRGKQTGYTGRPLPSRPVIYLLYE